MSIDFSGIKKLIHSSITSMLFILIRNAEVAGVHPSCLWVEAGNTPERSPSITGPRTRSVSARRSGSLRFIEGSGSLTRQPFFWPLAAKHLHQYTSYHFCLGNDTRHVRRHFQAFELLQCELNSGEACPAAPVSNQ